MRSVVFPERLDGTECASTGVDACDDTDRLAADLAVFHVVDVAGAVVDSGVYRLPAVGAGEGDVVEHVGVARW